MKVKTNDSELLEIASIGLILIKLKIKFIRVIMIILIEV